MYIRRTQTNSTASNEAYFTHRLVRGERIGGKVRQVTVLNLGRHFPIKQEDWPLLCSRIEQLLQPQDSLLEICCPASIEQAAQRYAGQLIVRAPQAEPTVAPPAEPTSMPESGVPAIAAIAPAPAAPSDYQEVDINSLQLTQPRSVGVEHVGLHALHQLGLVEKLAELGLNGVMRAAIIGNIIGRIAKPASELSTWNWLQTQSALGELIEGAIQTEVVIQAAFLI
jgi:hypothetical protein